MNYGMLVVLLAVLVVITNIIVQVIKDVSSLSKKPTKMVTVFVAMIITVCSCFAYFQYSGVSSIPWYFILAFFIAGFVAVSIDTISACSFCMMSCVSISFSA